MARFIVRATLAWMALTSVQNVTGRLLLPPIPPHGVRGWLLILSSTALVALVTSVLAGRVDRRGWQRALVLFAIVWGIHFNNLTEAALFSLDLPRSVLPLLFLDTFLATLALVFVLDRLSGQATSGRSVWPEGLRAGSWIARFAACESTYVVLYLGAGVLVWPFVRHFYAAREVPALGSMLLMQLVRGLIFTGLLLLMVARLRGSRAAIAVLGGVTLSVLGGVAPLMVPNPYMPEAVRLPHLVEVGVSNFLFGWIATSVLTGHRKGTPALRPPGS